MHNTARVVTTDDEIAHAIKRARDFAKYDRRVVKASYLKASDRLRIILDDGGEFSLSRHLVQGLDEANIKELSRIQIIGGGTGLLWPLLDVSHYVPGLLEGVYGTEKWMAKLYRQRRKLQLVRKARGGQRT